MRGTVNKAKIVYVTTLSQRRASSYPLLTCTNKTVPTSYQQRHPFFDIQTRKGTLHSNSWYVREVFNPFMDPKWFVQPGLIRTLKLQLNEWHVVDWTGWFQSFSYVYENKMGRRSRFLSTEMVHGIMSTTELRNVNYTLKDTLKLKVKLKYASTNRTVAGQPEFESKYCHLW